MFSSTIIPFGSLGATNGAQILDGIFTFGASARLGGIYGGSKVLVFDSSSLSGTGVVSVALSFLFLFIVCFPFEYTKGPDTSSLGFTDGRSRTFPVARTSYCVGGTYPVVSSIMRVCDAGPNSASMVALVLDIEITMKLLRLLKLQTTISLLSCKLNETKLGCEV